MSWLQQICTGKDIADEYATRRDFCRLFSENLGSLYQLSYLLTGDDEKAQQCFVAGLEDCVKANNVFKDWARSWANRAIIKNAIRTLRPRPADSVSSSPATQVSEKNKLRIIRDRHLEIDSVVALEDFERFVFVMTVLERYSDHETALLIGCSIAEIRAARIRALEEVANLTSTDSSREALAGHAPAEGGEKAEDNHKDSATSLVA